jgi:small-conductance mechanosensitive channel
MAVAQLKIDTEIIRIVTSLLLAGMALAFGLSFGLGSRELTRNIIAGFYARKVLRVGETIEVAGERGLLESITSTHALIRTDAQTVTVANARLLDEVARQDRD